MKSSGRRAVATGCGAGPSVMPNGGAYGSLTAAWGARRSPHGGIDNGGPRGRAVIAAADGTVTMVRSQSAERDRHGPNGGNELALMHAAELPDGAKHVFTIYSYLGRVEVRPGDKVKQGQRIGTMSDTGCAHYRCTPHVHFEVHPWVAANHEDPAKFIVGCHDPQEPPAFDRQKMLVYPIAC